MCNILNGCKMHVDLMLFRKVFKPLACIAFVGEFDAELHHRTAKPTQIELVCGLFADA